MNWQHELAILDHAIRLAGDTALRMAADGFEIHTKADQSPVTSADLAVNDLLHRHLMTAFPADGWLSEESPDTAARRAKRRVWVVDPIDGTSAFIRHEPDFCISVALVEDGHPVLAAVFNPSLDELAVATSGGGARLNDKPLPVNGHAGDRPTVAVSPWEQQAGRLAHLDAQMISHPMRSIAWALALAASSRIQAVATWESQNEWDIAAGALLVQEAGGLASDGTGAPLLFNRAEPRVRGLVATSRHCPAAVARQLRRSPSSH